MQPNQKHKLDRRVQRTVQSLRTALLELIKEKNYDDISIEEITERANVGRATFYLHFKDKEDLLLEEFTEIMDVRAQALRNPVFGVAGKFRRWLGGKQTFAPPVACFSTHPRPLRTLLFARTKREREQDRRADSKGHHGGNCQIRRKQDADRSDSLVVRGAYRIFRGVFQRRVGEHRKLVDQGRYAPYA